MSALQQRAVRSVDETHGGCIPRRQDKDVQGRDPGCRLRCRDARHADFGRRIEAETEPHANRVHVPASARRAEHRPRTRASNPPPLRSASSCCSSGPTSQAAARRRPETLSRTPRFANAISSRKMAETVMSTTSSTSRGLFQPHGRLPANIANAAEASTTTAEGPSEKKKKPTPVADLPPCSSPHGIVARRDMVGIDAVAQAERPCA